MSKENAESHDSVEPADTHLRTKLTATAHGLVEGQSTSQSKAHPRSFRAVTVGWNRVRARPSRDIAEIAPMIIMD